jgi:L-fuconolactonase
MTHARRTFLKCSVLAGAAAFTRGAPFPLAAAPEEPKHMPIVDTHQHLWDLELFQPPWLESAPDVLRQSYVTHDYLQETQGLNVVKAVYMEIDVDPRQQVQEAEHVVELCRSADHPTVAAVISGRPASPEFDAYIARFKDSPYIKGVRQVLHTPAAPPRLCLEPQFVQSMRRLGEMGMRFDLCMRPGELSHGAELAALCPETRFVIDHCGNADPKAFMKTPPADAAPAHDVDRWRRDMHDLAARPNTVCKISGIVASAPTGWEPDHLAPIINDCLDTFGPDRVMFASDWPVCRLRATYRQWVEALEQIVAARPESERRRLFHDNAVKFYDLQ